MHPLFQETNRLRIIRRYVAGYACLIAGLFGLVELLVNFLGGNKSATVHWSFLILPVCLLIAGICNLLTTKNPGE